MTEPEVIGLDLSLNATGVALPDGSVRTVSVDGDGIARIAETVNVLAGLVPLDVELVMIEGYSYGSSTAHVREIAELGGVVRHGLYRTRVPYLDVPPTTVKKYTTGSGKASKLAVLRAAEKRLGYGGESFDEADALWLRAIGCALLGVPLLTLPKSHAVALDVLAKVAPVIAPAR